MKMDLLFFFNTRNYILYIHNNSQHQYGTTSHYYYYRILIFFYLKNYIAVIHEFLFKVPKNFSTTISASNGCFHVLLLLKNLPYLIYLQEHSPFDSRIFHTINRGYSLSIEKKARILEF